MATGLRVLNEPDDHIAADVSLVHEGGNALRIILLIRPQEYGDEARQLLPHHGEIWSFALLARRV